MQPRSLFGRYLLGALLTAGITLADLFIKRLVASSFLVGERLEIIPGFFAITLIRNPGVAFGLLSSWDSSIRLPLLLAVTIVALGFIFYLYLGPLGARTLPAVGLPLIAGGALANFYERLTVGAVVDYLDFYISSYHWPAFNLADTGITLGVALLLLDSLWDQSEVP
jgi:signal peptidase II